MTARSDSPFLDVRDVRADDERHVATEAASFRCAAKRVLLVGAPTPLVRALAGLVLPSAGEVRFEGQHAATWFARGELALADATLAMPPKWTVRQYIETSARLSSPADSRRSAKERTTLAIRALALDPLASTRIERATPTARAATHLAAALATGATRLVVNELLTGLAAEELSPVWPFMKEALSASSFVLCAVHVHERLAEIADEVVFFRAGLPIHQGTPRELAQAPRTVFTRVLGSPLPLAAALEERGFVVSRTAGGLAVTLPDGEAQPIFEAARDADALVTELGPLYTWPAP